MIAKLEAIAPVMFNIQRDVECFLCASEKIIIEFAMSAEIIIPKIRIFNAVFGVSLFLLLSVESFRINVV